MKKGFHGWELRFGFQRRLHDVSLRTVAAILFCQLTWSCMPACIVSPVAKLSFPGYSRPRSLTPDCFHLTPTSLLNPIFILFYFIQFAKFSYVVCKFLIFNFVFSPWIIMVNIFVFIHTFTSNRFPPFYCLCSCYNLLLMLQLLFNIKIQWQQKPISQVICFWQQLIVYSAYYFLQNISLDFSYPKV